MSIRLKKAVKSASVAPSAMLAPKKASAQIATLIINKKRFASANLFCVWINYEFRGEEITASADAYTSSELRCNSPSPQGEGSLTKASPSGEAVTER